jgi:hypothetical protein
MGLECRLEGVLGQGTTGTLRTENSGPHKSVALGGLTGGWWCGDRGQMSLGRWRISFLL